MNLVCTETSGFVYSQYLPFTMPLMQAYAARIGADFVHELSERKRKYPLFGKFCVGKLLEKYDRILFLDCDILVRPDAPDIFAIVPDHRFAALNEGSWCNAEELMARQERLERAAQAFSLPLNDFDMTRHYFNGGVFLACREHQYLFNMPSEHPFMSEVTAEQNVLNLRLRAGGYPTYNLPSCFNAMPWRWSARYVDDNWFIHYAGMKSSERAQRIAEDLRYLQNKF
jgi:lipopolysaccharide biosynthesis glycosyltransferase